MRRLLLTLILLLLAGCHGGGNSDNAARLQLGPEDLGTKSGLQFSWTEAGGAIEVTLVATQADDLYQAAATITYPPDKYTPGEIVAAGGLGSPTETYFAGAVTQPGRLEFGYTKRFVGSGAYGDVALLRFTVAEAAAFDIGDFAVDYSEEPPLARDSRKHPIELSAPGGAR